MSPDDPLANRAFPAPLELADVPPELRDNPLVQHLLTLSPEEAALFEQLARLDAQGDTETVAAVLADAT